MSTLDSLRSTTERLFDQGVFLLRQELELAKTEVAEQVQDAQQKPIAIIAGLLLGFCGLLILLEAVVAALATAMPVWAASLIVGGVVAIIAAVLVRSGQQSLAKQKFAPDRTVRSLQRDKDMVVERMS